MAVIAAEQLAKSYGRRVGVRDLSFEVRPGTILGFLGPNGAGKSTTIRLLMGLLRPSAGRAHMLGRDCWSESHRIKPDVGYLPGDLRLYHWLSGRTALAIVSGVRGRDLRPDGQALAECLQLDLGVRVRQMSRGMRQKLGLILAMAHRPRVLILDEPSSALDPLTQEQLYAQLRAAAARGQTVLFSSHVLSEVDQLCDEVAILREGRLLIQEKLDVLRTRARREVTLVWTHAPDKAENRPAALPAFLELVQRDEPRWRCTLQGSVHELLRWAAAQPLADIVIAPPDLDTLFNRYYAGVHEETEAQTEADL